MLSVIWAGIIGFAILVYILLDGFDLGIGVLFPFMPCEENRNIMMNSIAPVWDGNATWLVFGGATLYSAFPLAFGVLLPTIYMPVMLMLAALIFRGIAFEFRFKATKSKPIWDNAFTAGSTVAAMMQGIILGTFVSGYDAALGTGAEGTYPWLTPFTLTTGIAVVCGYALLGATWLIVKTEGDVQNYAYSMAKKSLFWVVVFLGIVSLWTPFQDPHIAARWFTVPNVFFLMPLPIISLAAVVGCAYALHKRMERRPFALSLFIFLCGYIGLGISVWPYAVPHKITLWQAASPAKTQIFVLIGTLIILPILLFYTAYAYRVFKGKVHGEGFYD